MPKSYLATSEGSPTSYVSTFPANTNVFSLLASMQQQLNDMTKMLEQRQFKVALVPQKIKVVEQMHQRQKQNVQREMIQQNQKMIRMLEREQLEIQRKEYQRINNQQREQIQMQRFKLKEKEERVQYQKLLLEQQRKELIWKQKQNQKKQNYQMTKQKVKNQIRMMQEKIRNQMGISDFSQTDLDQSSFFVELNKHWPITSQKDIPIFAKANGNSCSSLNNVPSIKYIKQMNILSPLNLVLDIKDSRYYPFGEPSSISLGQN